MEKHIGGMAAEFIGAFALMFVGGCAIMVSGGNLAGIALAHGLILGVMVTAFMHISGGQLNPAVSLGLAAIGRQSWPRTILFVISQCAGAVVAAWLITKSYPEAVVTANKLGATLGDLSTGDAANPKMVLVLEAVATFFLMIVVLGSAVDPRGTGKTAAVGGLAIGLTVTADIMAIGKLTGASMNPSRSFGPALVGGYWDIQAIYWLGPILGAVIAAIVWNTLMGGKSAK